MTDIALALSPDGSTTDLVVIANDLATDDTLATAVLFSLQTDRLADPEDVIPDGSTNRRGWWMDSYLTALLDGTPYLSGSKLWLRRRALATQQTANLIQEDCLAALAWMKTNRVVADVTVTTTWTSDTGLAVTVSLSRFGAAGASAETYALLWDRTLGTITMSGGAA
jgi:phage gp46-like protein